MSTPLVSIVIPVYNSEKTISKCLDSLVSQTFKDIEIICVNDCSKDNSLYVLNDYASKDDRIVVINHGENMNAGGARNSGILAAKGEYICLVDNDDWLELNAIESLFIKSEDCKIDLILSDLCQVFPDGTTHIIHNIPNELLLKKKIEWGLLNGGTLLGSLIRRDLYISNMLFYPERRFYEDNPVHFTLFTSAKSIVSTGIAYYNYYQLPNSVTRSTTLRKIQDRIFTNELLLENTKRVGTFFQYREYIETAYIHLTCHTIFLLSKMPLRSTHRILKKEISKLKELQNNGVSHMVNNRYKFLVKYPYIWLSFNYAKNYIAKIKRNN